MKPKSLPKSRETESDTARAVLGLAGSLAVMTLVSSLGLVMNAGLLYSCYRALSTYPTGMGEFSKMGQLFLYCGPVLLLYPEWALWDALTDRIRD